MERHLTLEALARLVDESPDGDEAVHLDTCTHCRRELDELRNQTQALAGLPAVRPGAAAWSVMEARLEAEGLLGNPRVAEARGREGTGREGERPGTQAASMGGTGIGRANGGPARSFPWSRLAAGLLLFLFGAGVGSITGSSGLFGPGSDDERRIGAVHEALEALLATPGDLSPTEAQEALAVAEEWHRLALERYREQMVGEAGDGMEDPHLRYALMETLLQAGREALWAAPTDPFLNGLVLNVQVEQDAALMGMARSSPDRVWY